MRRLVGLVIAATIALGGRAAHGSSMTVDSSAFWNGGAIPPFDSASSMGCTGRNVSPPLRITGIPPATRSLAVVMFDPDAGAKTGFTHWVAYGISPHRTSLPSGFGSSPGAFVGGRNDAGTDLYVGPCPPKGDSPHHYTFSVYALPLDPATLPPGLTRAAFLHAALPHALAVATITATFGR